MVELPGFSFKQDLDAYTYLCWSKYLSEDIAKRNNARKNAAQELASRVANAKAKAKRRR